MCSCSCFNYLVAYTLFPLSSCFLSSHLTCYVSSKKVPINGKLPIGPVFFGGDCQWDPLPPLPSNRVASLAWPCVAFRLPLASMASPVAALFMHTVYVTPSTHLHPQMCFLLVPNPVVKVPHPDITISPFVRPHFDIG